MHPRRPASRLSVRQALLLIFLALFATYLLFARSKEVISAMTSSPEEREIDRIESFLDTPLTDAERCLYGKRLAGVGDSEALEACGIPYTYTDTQSVTTAMPR